MYITLQNLLTAAAILSAATALLAAYNKTYDWLRRQQKQDEAIADLKAEQGLLTRGAGLSQGAARAGLQRPRHRGHPGDRKLCQPKSTRVSE